MTFLNETWFEVVVTGRLYDGRKGKVSQTFARKPTPDETHAVTREFAQIHRIRVVEVRRVMCESRRLAA